ncbi:MAG: hypothetical protein ACF8QF_08885 [Phycisphaerales bacterium]
MTTSPQPHDNSPAAASDGLSWSVLLARWTEFAQASLALPRTEEGDRWRSAVPPIIGLQALAFALADLGRLAPGDRPLALERAEAGISAHARDLHALWAGEPLPESIAEVIDDARAALRLVATAGNEWRVAASDFIAPDPAPIARAALDAGFTGDLWLALPGTRLAEGAPCAFARPEWPRLAIDAADGPHWSPQRQIYRQPGADQRAARDIILPVEAGLPAGRPLLVPVIEAGRIVFASNDGARDAWINAQRVAGVFDQPPEVSVGAGDGAGGSDSSG